jgi:hypothetical protein
LRQHEITQFKFQCRNADPSITDRGGSAAARTGGLVLFAKAAQQIASPLAVRREYLWQSEQISLLGRDISNATRSFFCATSAWKVKITELSLVGEQIKVLTVCVFTLTL